MPHQLLPFLLVVAVMTVAPGPDVALALRNGVSGGSTTAWWTGLGCCTGIAAHACASVLGLSALLTASAQAFTAVRVAGAAYLIVLGARSLRRRRTGKTREQPPQEGISRRAAFRQGVTSNLLNPKIILIFLTLLPQFVSPEEPRLATTAVLAAVFLTLGVLWWRVFSLLVAVLGRWLSSRRVRTALERVTGVVLISLGLRVAFDPN